MPHSAKHSHDNIVGMIKNEMPDDNQLFDLAELFRIFGDTTRMKIMYVLFESELCVGGIAELLNMTQSAVSHQLKLLKSARLVGSRREGKTIYYFLADDHVRTMINQGNEHILERIQREDK